MDQSGLEGSSPPLAAQRQRQRQKDCLSPGDSGQTKPLVRPYIRVWKRKGKREGGRKRGREGRRKKGRGGGRKRELFKAIDTLFVLIESIILNVYLHQNINY